MRSWNWVSLICRNHGRWLSLGPDINLHFSKVQNLFKSSLINFKSSLKV